MPTGVFLMSDIEGSTRLWAAHAQEMNEALARHDAVLAAVIEQHGGTVFKHTGDGLAASFESASDALAAGAQLQPALDDAGVGEAIDLRVRVGIHAGDAYRREGDWFGPTINRTARLMSAGHGGQVLASATAIGLAGEQLPGDLVLTDLGEHVLRDLAHAEHVFQISALPGLASFPPLRTIDAFDGNLPRQQSSFVGRVGELDAVIEELANGHLVTLVGPGGVGKTRLALQAAAELITKFPDGAWLCELAPTSSDAAVDHVVADTLGVRAGPNESARTALLRALADRAMLLVVDNCEHVLGATAELVGAIGRHAPDVRVLATSREALGLPSEQVIVLEPFAAATDGMALFAERARSVRRDFELTAANEAVVVEICRRLDGIPLAIELAAARARSLALRDLADRLDDRFRLLARRTSTSAGRHGTLEAAVAWSYEMLAPDEQRLFDRLSVFAGGFDLDAVTAVCAEPTGDVTLLDGLLALVDKSLVQVSVADEYTRYSVLETMRQYGAARLGASGEAEVVTAAHARYYAVLARTAQACFEGSAGSRGRELFEREWDNLRAAVGWAMRAAEPELLEPLIGAPYWYAYFMLRREPGEWALDAVTLPSVGPEVHAAASLAAHEQLGDARRALELADSGIARGRALGDVSTCWASRAAALVEGIGDIAGFHARKAEQAASTTDAPFTKVFLQAASAAPLAMVDPNGSVDDVAGARQLAASMHNTMLDTMVAWADACVTRTLRRDLAGTARRFERVAELALRCGSPRIHGLAMTGLAVWVDPAERDPVYRDLFEQLIANQDWANLAIALEALATSWVTSGDVEAAALILGHLEARNRRHAALAARRTRALEVVRAQPAGEDWLDRGRALAFDDVLAITVELLQGRLRE